MPKQSTYVVEVEPERPASGDKPSASKVYRSIVAKDGFPSIEPNTLFDLFDSSVKKYANNQCLGARKQTESGVGEFEFMTYAETGVKVAHVASGLKHLGIQPQQRVGIFGGNSSEWMMGMQACNRLSLHCVPLYDSLGENAIEYIIMHAEVQMVFVQASKLPQLIKAVKIESDKLLNQIKAVIYWGSKTADVEVATGLGLKVLSFDELITLGTANPCEPVPPFPSDPCTVMYTSGTTGVPKGVLITHEAVITCVCTLQHYCKSWNISIGEGDRMLSYLPLAHIFDRVSEEWFLYIGGTIGFWQGDVTKLVDDIAALKPSLFIGVPRVFDRIYGRIKDQITKAGGLKQMLFNWGYSRKMHFMKQGYKYNEAAPFFDRLVFSKIAARLGGKVKAIVSGGAPLAPHVEEFLKVTMCCPVVQGYGLTETCAASFIAIPDNYDQTATVGPPTPNSEFRLESIPDMNCDALDPDQPKGEVLIRSAMMFNEYYKMDEQTNEVLEKDGWFHTGDIAIMNKDGSIKIVDRKKNIFKLSQGEYVAVEKVEATFKKNLLVEQIWVYGNSFKSCLVAVVVPNKEKLMDWAPSAGITEKDFAVVCKDPKAKAYILGELIATGKAGKLKGFEIVKDILLEPNQFTIEEELLTPTFKLKRPQLQAKYQAQIDAMYIALKE